MVDTFVSHKMRRRLKYSFGFVCYKCMEEAQKVIQNFNGMAVKGCKIMVCSAKFDRGGNVIYEKLKDHGPKPKNVVSREAKKYVEAFRDNRSYKEVVVNGGKPMKVRKGPESDRGRVGRA